MGKHTRGVVKVTKQSNGITRRLIVYVVLFSSLITLFITTFQLFQEYREGVTEVEGQVAQIEKLSLTSVTENLWNLYEKQIQAQLEDLIQLPDVEYLEIQSEGGIIASTGVQPSENTIVETLPLVYVREDEDILIGHLVVVATLEDVYQDLLDRVIVILISNGLKTALVSLFIFLIFQLFVTRHLSRISSYLQNLSAEHLDKKLYLDRRPRKDELIQVVAAINEMGANLSETTVSKNYLDNIVAAMGDGLIVASPDAAIRLTNKRTQDLLEYDENELVGESVQVFFENLDETPLGKAGLEPAEGDALRVIEKNACQKQAKRFLRYCRYQQYEIKIMRFKEPSMWFTT